MTSTQKHTLILILLLTITGCTAHQKINSPISDTISIEQARQTKNSNKLVRWGGQIVSVENKNEQTVIEIVERPLTRFGVPKITQKTGGRFLANSALFIDPLNIKPGRHITVHGQLSSYQKGLIDEYHYEFPVVQIIEYKVWPKNNLTYYRHNSHYYHDPFFHPYYFHHRRYRHHYYY